MCCSISYRNRQQVIKKTDESDKTLFGCLLEKKAIFFTSSYIKTFDWFFVSVGYLFSFF